MNRRVLLIPAALLAGCTMPQQQPPPPPYVPAALVNPPPKPVEIPPDPFAGLSPAEQHAITSGRPKTLREGITVLYAYSPHTQPVVYCEPLRVTEIVLNRDEKINTNGVAAGDSTRWDIDPLDNRVLAKPSEPGLVTDLIIATNKRSYHLTLKSRAPYMAQVSFYYPDEILQAEAERNAALRKAAQQTTDPIPSKPLNFGYAISGPRYAWSPVQVFSDGERTYIQLPQDLAGVDLPVLYVQDNGENSLVNYEVKGSYLISDRLFRRAVLTSGAGSNREAVTIEAE